MYMRFIGTSIIIVSVLAATTGTGIFHDIQSIFEPIVLAMKNYGNADHTISCFNITADTADWTKMQNCIHKLGNTKTCYCECYQEAYAITNSNSNLQKFEACCEDGGSDWGYGQC
jgi:hypothetical protein